MEKLKGELFKGMSADNLQALHKIASKITLKKGDVLFKENDFPEKFYIILSGRVSLKKTNTSTGEQYKIRALGKNAVIGEMALIDKKSRSTTAIADQKTVLMVFSIDIIRKNKLVFSSLMENLSKILSERMRYINNVTVKSMQAALDEAKKRNALGVMLISSITVIVLYAFGLVYFSELSKLLPSSTFLGAPLIIIIAIVAWFGMKYTGFPLSEFGLTLKNWRPALYDALIMSIPILVIAAIIKGVYLSIYSSSGARFFDGPAIFKTDGVISYTAYFSSMLLYIIASPIQEFVARCGLQSGFQNFLTGPKNRVTWIAILLSNLMFALTHLHMSPRFAYLSFVLGLFWGWLYSRHRSIIGVSASHILIGVWGMFIIGFEQFL